FALKSLFTQVLDHFQTVHNRHINVRQYNIRLTGVYDFDSLATVNSLSCPLQIELSPRDGITHSFQQTPIIINNDNCSTQCIPLLDFAPPSRGTAVSLASRLRHD